MSTLKMHPAAAPTYRQLLLPGLEPEARTLPLPPEPPLVLPPTPASIPLPPLPASRRVFPPVPFVPPEAETPPVLGPAPSSRSNPRRV